MKNNWLKNLLVSIILSVFLGACNEESFYEKTYPLNNAKWVYGDSLKFEIEVADTLQYYDFYLTFRNTNAYSYSNVFFFLDSYYPNNDFARDTIECPLANPDGRWLGKNSGEHIDNNILFKRKVRFPKAGNYVFSFNHAMRQDTLKEIVDFGFKIKKHQ